MDIEHIEKLKFSVLTSVYIKNTVSEVNQCFESLRNQTLCASEIIIVIDGPLNKDVFEVINKWGNQLPFIIIESKKNIGLGKALNLGLKSCNYNYVFRIDIDDICHEERFKLQLGHLLSNPDIDILGGQIKKFEKIGQWKKSKNKPASSIKIRKYLKFRNPINHPTVAFKKDRILALGGYPDARIGQDYMLWIKAIANNYCIQNTTEIYVFMRISSDLYSRRGIRNCHYDLRSYKMMYKLNITNSTEFIFGVLIRQLFCIYSSLKSLF